MRTRGQKDDFSVPLDLLWLDGEGALLEVIECYNRGNLGSKLPICLNINSRGEDPSVLSSINGGVDEGVWID